MQHADTGKAYNVSHQYMITVTQRSNVRCVLDPSTSGLSLAITYLVDANAHKLTSCQSWDIPYPLEWQAPVANGVVAFFGGLHRRLTQDRGL